MKPVLIKNNDVTIDLQENLLTTMPVQRFAMGVEYDGSNFHGWQKQPGKRTVEGVLNQAIGQFINQPAFVCASGRTDAGVHALEQVVHLDTSVIRKEFSWVRGINGILRTLKNYDVTVLWAKAVSMDFHARFSAIARTYQYDLYVGKTQPACFRHYQGYCMHTQALDIEAMQMAANYLIGRHDFSSFRSSECQSPSPIKTINFIEIIDNYPNYSVIIQGNAFLHHMIRNIMGLLILIACNKQPVSFAKQVLEAKNRCKAPPTFMPNGLFLKKIDYLDSHLLF